MLCLHQTPRKTCFRKQETEHINQSIQNESTPGCYVRLSLLRLQPTRSNQNCFWMPFWDSPLLDPKKLQNQQTILYNRLNKEKNSWSMLPIWLLAAMMIMMYYWRFWEPWANAMLVVLLPKLWKSWLAQLFLDVFLGLTLTGPKKASKRTILHNRLNMEKTPGRCCQSGYLLPWWLWCTIGGFGNPAQILC